MDIVIPRCCGIDVHQKSLVACVRLLGPQGTVTRHRRTFGTMTDDLRALAAWLQEAGVTHAAIESTGVLWKPVWNVLESTVTLVLVNPRDVKQVPGRKTDVSDAEWIAQLLQCGLLRRSFVPPLALRQLRDLTRNRTILEQQRAAVVNRLHKVLEDANLKLGTVVSDIVGVSGRAMLRAVIAGETDAVALANLARRSLRRKIPQLQRALAGHVTAHHRFVLGRLLTELDFIDQEADAYSRQILDATQPFADALARLDTIPGVDRRTAENVLAEIGPDMAVFPTAGHLASWAAICPGHHESAGRQTHGTTRKANPWLRRTLVQASWGAIRKKGAYPGSQYRRLVGTRGKKRAIVAVAHTLLRVAYYVLRDGVDYRDLGADHYDRLAPEKMTRYLVKRLERLGHKVTIEAAA
jgi:transposase